MTINLDPQIKHYLNQTDLHQLVAKLLTELPLVNFNRANFRRLPSLTVYLLKYMNINFRCMEIFHFYRVGESRWVVVGEFRDDSVNCKSLNCAMNFLSGNIEYISYREVSDRQSFDYIIYDSGYPLEEVVNKVPLSEELYIKHLEQENSRLKELVKDYLPKELAGLVGEYTSLADQRKKEKYLESKFSYPAGKFIEDY